MRIGFIGHGPGSVNVISVLMKPLKLKGYTVVSYPFSEYGVELMGGTLRNKENYLDIFTEDNLDIIIYGTGSLHEYEKDVAVLSRHYGIYSISILDALEFGSESMRYFNQPNKVVCLNKDFKNHILSVTGMKYENVSDLGNPYLDKYEEYSKHSYSLIDLNKLKVVYASEPSGSKTCNDTSERSKQAILELIELVREGIIEKLTICVHPRESSEWIKRIIKTEINVKLGLNPTMIEVETNDLCLSLGSTIYFECILKKIHSLKFKDKDTFKRDLVDYDEPDILEIEFGATDRIVQFIMSIELNKDV